MHRAFWRPSAVASGEGGRAGQGDGGAESYIGPILSALESRLGADAVRYVGVGPSTNFRARRWWDPLSGGPPEAVRPIEWYAPYAAMGPRATSTGAATIRGGASGPAPICGPTPSFAASIAGRSCGNSSRGSRCCSFPGRRARWTKPRQRCAPSSREVAVTYAEAGGWGRAIALEARRLGVPLAGLQHGFIYRHWLNYRHEADEMAPDTANPQDRGFPLPAKTLLFDEHAAAQLQRNGSFPATHSPSPAARGSTISSPPSRALTAADVAAPASAPARAPRRRSSSLPPKSAKRAARCRA